ncbi:cell division protein FtsQ [Desulfocucumis palustris]|uniref:Cell division protein FtsQ n=1 Tax=Desulfocucumis palustris TaxID=1898651 RepID=A0A2L2XDY3_9FIRM|nr:FtsQ-type POTRA domain-containing protein [Desulfocucumis palustris]GBF34448.1 cell division protein FtsQ [Desulfocucumis palustris]
MSGWGTANKKRGYNLWQSVFFVFLVTLGLYILLRSPLFEVRGVTVEGNNYLATEKILSVSGINTGENIFKINLKEASERLKIIPMLKSVELERRLPATVLIKVTERSPVALFSSSGGFIQVDAEGVYLQKGSPSDRNLPVVTGIKYVLPSPGKPLKGQGLDTALRVVRELPEELLPKLSEVNINEQGNVCLYTLDGIQCRLGSPEDVSEKAMFLSRVIDELKAKNKKIEYVDLSYVGSPVVQYLEP